MPYTLKFIDTLAVEVHSVPGRHIPGRKFSQARPWNSSTIKNMFTTVTLQRSKALQYIIHILCRFQHFLILKLMALLLDWHHVSQTQQDLKHTASEAACCFLSERPPSVIQRPVFVWTRKQSPPGSGACRRVSGGWACTHLSAQPEEVTCRLPKCTGPLLCQ